MSLDIKKLQKAFPAQEKGCEYYTDGCKLMFSSHGDGIYIGEFRKDYGPEYAKEVADLLNAAPELLRQIADKKQKRKKERALGRVLRRAGRKRDRDGVRSSAPQEGEIDGDHLR